MSHLRFVPPHERVINSRIKGEFAGLSLIEFLCKKLRFFSREQWLENIAQARLSINGVTAKPEDILQPGYQLTNRMPISPEPPADTELNVIYEDEDYWIINKGSPLAIHPCGFYTRNTLLEVLKEKFPDKTYLPCHRLDAATSGVQVMAKHKTAARVFMQQALKQELNKMYLAKVEGLIIENNFNVNIPIGNKPGHTLKSTAENCEKAQWAETEFKVLLRENNFTYLQVKPITGRTNQIRVHLAHVGHPIHNDRIYGSGQKWLQEFGLHAYQLSFKNPAGTVLKLKAPAPSHFDAIKTHLDLPNK